MKIKYVHIALIILAVVLLSTVSFAASTSSVSVVPVEAYATDAVAGSAVVLRTSKIPAGLPVTFVVTQPNTQQIKIEGVSDSSGVAYAKLSDYYTKFAGIYTVAAVIDPAYPSRANSFVILPGKISLTNSELLPKNQVIHAGVEMANLTVRLRDDFDNPVNGHIVKLISSSENDDIDYRNDNISDKNGEVHFQMNPGVAGLVNYSLYDLTADQVLSSRAKVVYFNSTAQVFSQKSGVKLASAADFQRHGALASAVFSSNEGNAAGPIDHFKFEDVSQNIGIDKSATIKVTAYDIADQIVSNYAGTVRFSIDGSNSGFAILPNDYTFALQDQGSHVFSLAFNFKQPGVYNLKASDLSNMAIFGTKSVTVAATAGSASGSSNGITIINPTASTFSSNLQVVTGTAPSAVKLKIFDNNVEIASLVADSSGKFSYTTGLLADGPHKLYVASVNDIGTVISTSATIDFTISTKSAKISQIIVEPSTPVDPGVLVGVKVYSDDNLSKAQLVVAGNIYDLTKNPAGYYETSFKAPIDFGQYKLGFTFKSELGNESKSDDKTLQVGKVGLSNSSKPAVVTGVVAQPADGRVILTWAAPVSLANPVKNYRVLFGNSPNQLSNAADTFTNTTTWFISNLKNGTEYYFAVVAVDMKGNISDGFDKIVPATPSGAVNKVQSPGVQNGTDGKDQIKYMNADASKTGPEVSWLVILSIFGGFFYTFIRKIRFN